MSANQPYAQFPDHALHNVSQAVLEAGWRAVGAEPTGDAAEVRLKALADMVTLAMLPGLRDWLRGELLDELRGKLQHHLVERDDPCSNARPGQTTSSGQAPALHDDPWDQAPDKQAYGNPPGVTNAMVAASHKANENYVHPADEGGQSV